MNKRERVEAEAMGCRVVGCFEEEYDSLPVADIPPRFLRNNFYPDRFLKPLTLEKRREVLGKMITFWRRIFEIHEPTACVHESVSFEPEEVISRICLQMQVRDLTYSTVPVPGYFFWKPDPYSTSIPKKIWESVELIPEFLKLSRKIVDQIRNKTFSQPYYSYFDPEYRHIGRGYLVERFLVYLFSQIAHKLPSNLGIRVLRRFCRERGYPLPCPLKEVSWKHLVFYSNDCKTLPRHFYHELYDEWCRRTHYYDDMNSYKNFRLVAYPLHYEPEATTLYYAPECSDQAATVNTIARNLPLDTVLVVKEHPSQPGRLLTREFQNVRLNNPNLCYLPAKVTNYELLDRCDVIATASSTLGWEALCYGKPVIVFGKVYYDNHPQVLRLEHPCCVRNVEFDQLPPPKREESELLLAKLLSMSYRGEISVGNLTEENVSHITEAIHGALTSEKIPR